MDADIVNIYKKLSSHYPIVLSSSVALGFNSDIDFPVLHGESPLGRFELFFDDSSFAFYALHSNREVFAHWHLQTSSEAEKSITDFMKGKITRPDSFCIKREKEN